MLNPLTDLVKELRKMNVGLIERLDKIIDLLTTLIDIELDNDHG